MLLESESDEDVRNCGVNKIKSRECFVERARDVLFMAVPVG